MGPGAGCPWRTVVPPRPRSGLCELQNALCGHSEPTSWRGTSCPGLSSKTGHPGCWTKGWPRRMCGACGVGDRGGRQSFDLSALPVRPLRLRWGIPGRREGGTGWAPHLYFCWVPQIPQCSCLSITSFLNFLIYFWWLLLSDNCHSFSFVLSLLLTGMHIRLEPGPWVVSWLLLSWGPPWLRGKG